MQEFLSKLKVRPACLFASLFLISLYCAFLFCSDIKIIVAALLIVFFLAALAYVKLSGKGKGIFKASVMLLSLSLSLVLSYFTFDVGYYEKVKPLTGVHSCEIALTDIQYSDSAYTSYGAVILSYDGTPCKIRTLLSLDSECLYSVGQTLKGEFSIRPSYSESGDSSSKYRLSKGFLTLSSPTDSGNVAPYSQSSVFPYTQIGKLQAFCEKALEKHLDGQSLALSKALIYGNQSSLDSSLKGAFQYLGVSHTLSISGLHLGIIITLVGSLLSLFGMPRRARSLCVLISALLYTFIAGFAPPVTRTFLMFTLLICSDFAGRRRDPVTTLTLAAAVICLVSPYSVFDIGFQLSFFSTLAILTYSAELSKGISKLKMPKVCKNVLSLCIITVCACLFTLPYSIYVFGSLSLISPVANLIYIPLITAAVYLSPFVVIFSFASPVASFFALLTKLVSSLTFYITEAISPIAKIFLVTLTHPFARIFGAVIIALILFLMLFQQKKSRVFSVFCIYLSAVMASTLLLSCLHYPSNQIHMYSSDRESTLVVTSRNSSLVIAGKALTYDSFKLCADKTEADSVCKISAIVFTAVNQNTAKELSKILESYPEVKSLTLCISALPERSELEFSDDVKLCAKERGVKYTQASYGQNLKFNAFEFTLLQSSTTPSDIGVLFSASNDKLLVSSPAFSYDGSELPSAKIHFESQEKSKVLKLIYDEY